MDAQVSDAVVEKAADGIAQLLYKFLLTEFARSEVRYQDLTDAERDELHARAWDSIKSACMVGAQTLSTMGQTFVKGDLEKTATKDKIIVTVAVPRLAAARHELHDAVGQQVLIVLAQAGFDFGRQPMKETTGELIDADGEPIDDDGNDPDADENSDLDEE
jgi:hypothetical protein